MSSNHQMYNVTKNFEGKIMGKPIGNLECAQPSLFVGFFLVRGGGVKIKQTNDVNKVIDLNGLFLS